jgi:hypothetical protein
MGEKINALRILVEKSFEKWSFGRRRRRWKENVKTILS